MIFEITETQNGYYKVDWEKYVTGMSVASVDKFPKFLKLVTDHLKGTSVGLGGTSCVYHLTHRVFIDADWERVAYNVYENFKRMNEHYVVSIYYQTREEAESFGNDLEQRYIIDILKK